MIEINLLPEELKKKESPLKKIDITAAIIRNVSFTKLAVIIFGTLAAIHILMFGAGLVSKVRFSVLSGKYSQISGKEKDAIALKARSETISSKKSAIDELMIKRLEWAKKLNDLSDSMVAGIWLTGLSLNEKSVDDVVSKPKEPSDAADAKKKKGLKKRVIKYMSISGYAYSKGEEGTASIGRFIKSLRASESFYRDFNDVELGSIKRDKFEDQDVMSFSITCLFK